MSQSSVEIAENKEPAGAAMGQTLERTASATSFIDRYRYLWFALAFLFLLCSFNGEWRVGPDSAAYRELGHQLATTGRYYFRDDLPGISEYHNQQGTRYPGLPIMLAVVEKLFGPGAGPPLVVMLVLAILTMALVYRLMLYRVPRWLAVCVTVGVGTNPKFLQYTSELLSDLPFLFGVVLALLGFEMVIRASDGKQLGWSLLTTFLGLVVAASMRPTFLMLAAAIVAGCGWAILTGRVGLERSTFPASLAASGSASVSVEADPIDRRRLRRRCILILLALVVTGITFLTVIDIRLKHGRGLFAGGYEARMLWKFGKQGVLPLVPWNLGELLENAMPMALLGFRSGWGLVPLATHWLGAGTVFSIGILVAGTWMARRNVVWGALVFISATFLILVGPIPRYILMILPILLAGWGMMIYRIGERFRSPRIASLVLRVGLSLVLLLNLTASTVFILVQRGFTISVDSHHRWRGLHHVGFLTAYHFGQARATYALADLIRQKTKPTEKIIVPDSDTLTYLSDRQVYGPAVDMRLIKVQRIFHKALFPVEPNWRQASDDYATQLRKTLKSAHLHQGSPIAPPTAGYVLCELVPPHPPRRVKKKPPAHKRLATTKPATTQTVAAQPVTTSPATAPSR